MRSGHPRYEPGSNLTHRPPRSSTLLRRYCSTEFSNSFTLPPLKKCPPVPKVPKFQRFYIVYWLFLFFYFLQNKKSMNVSIKNIGSIGTIGISLMYQGFQRFRRSCQCCSNADGNSENLQKSRSNRQNVIFVIAQNRLGEPCRSAQAAVLACFPWNLRFRKERGASPSLPAHCRTYTHCAP